MAEQSKINIYVLRTHFINGKILELYKQYQNDFGFDNSFMLLDTTNMDPKDIPTDLPNLITITAEQAASIDPLFNKFHHTSMYYRAEALLIHLYDNITKQRGKIDYMWLIEYDVYCRGSFAKALQPCHNIDCDLLGKGGDTVYEARKYWKTPEWGCWDILFGELAQMPHRDRKGVFFAITRYSPRMIDTIKANLGKSTGFCELYLPCLCVANGLTYKAMPFGCIGDVRYVPHFTQKEIERYAQPDKLYHPVKLQHWEAAP